MTQLHKLLLFIVFIMKYLVVAQLPDCKMSYIAPTPPGFMYYLYETPLNGIPIFFDGLNPLQMVYRFYILGQPLYVGTATDMSFALPEVINNETVVQGTLYGNSITLTNFSMVANGWIRVNQTGYYTFTMEADYAAAMYIFSDPRTLCLDAPLAGSYNYSSFYISSSVTQPAQQLLSGQVYLVSGVPYQMGLSYIHPWGAPKCSVSVIDANGQYHPDISYLLSTLNTYSNGVQPTLDYEQVNVTSAFAYGGATTTLFSVASNTASVSDNGLTVITTYYYYTPTTTISPFITLNSSMPTVILSQSSEVPITNNSGIIPGSFASAVSITVETSSSTTNLKSKTSSSTSLSSVNVSAATLRAVSSIKRDNFSHTLFHNSFTELTSLISSRGQNSETLDIISKTTMLSNQISISKFSQNTNILQPTSLIFGNSTSNPTSTLEDSFDISALPRAQGVTGTDVMVESTTFIESGINGQSTTEESTVTQQITHTTFKVSSMKLSFIGFPTNLVPTSHPVVTEAVSGIEDIVIILECPICENGVTVITPSGINNNNAVATETGGIFQITSHVSLSRDTVLFVSVDYSGTGVEGLDNLATSIPIIETNTPSLTSIELYSNVRPTDTADTVIEAAGGAFRYKGTYSSGIFGTFILYFIFLV